MSTSWILLSAAALAMSLSTTARADEPKAAAEGVVIPPHAVTAPAWDTISDEAEHGRILKLVLETEDGHPVYEAKILTSEGDVYEVEVDIDGNLLEKEKEGGAGAHGHDRKQ